MKTRVMLALVVLLAVPLAMPAEAQRTSFDFDNTADFSKYKRFAWREGTPAPDAFLDQRIAAAIESQLVARGLTRSDTEPDVYVRYHVALDVQKTVSGWSGPEFVPFVWGWGGGRVDLQLNELLVGTLFIDVADAVTGRLVWRGVGVGDIDVHAKPAKRDASITKAVTKILKNFPPPGGQR